jgi:type IV secretory pathway TrbD component
MRNFLAGFRHPLHRHHHRRAQLMRQERQMQFLVIQRYYREAAETKPQV